jgi:hypothetical protein
MKYMLLIHQGDTPTPNSPDEWGRLSEDEQKEVYDAYRAPHGGAIAILEQAFRDERRAW